MKLYVVSEEQIDQLFDRLPGSCDKAKKIEVSIAMGAFGLPVYKPFQRIDNEDN